MCSKYELDDLHESRRPGLGSEAGSFSPFQVHGMTYQNDGDDDALKAIVKCDGNKLVLYV